MDIKAGGESEETMSSAQNSMGSGAQRPKDSIKYTHKKSSTGRQLKKA